MCPVVCNHLSYTPGGSETLYAATWTNSGGAQTGSYTGTPPTGSQVSASNIEGFRTGTSFTKINTWTSSTITVAWSAYNCWSGSDDMFSVYTTSTLNVDYSLDSGSTWVNVLSVTDSTGNNYTSGAGSVTTGNLGNVSVQTLQFRTRVLRGNKIGQYGFIGAANITLTNFRIEGLN